MSVLKCIGGPEELAGRGEGVIGEGERGGGGYLGKSGPLRLMKVNGAVAYIYCIVVLSIPGTSRYVCLLICSAYL